MWQAIIPALASLYASYQTGKNKGTPEQNFSLTPEQRSMIQNIVSPELMSRYANRGKFNIEDRNMYLSDILGGVESGYSAQQSKINTMNLDPVSRQYLTFQNSRDKATNTAAGYRSLVDKEQQRMDDTLNLASGLGTKSIGTFQTNNGYNPGNMALWGNLSNILGGTAGNMAQFQGDPNSSDSTWSQYMKKQGWS